jgi:uroporphyrinogen-III synthase
VSLRRKLSQPLAGLRVLVGRARPQAGTLAAELKRLGAHVLEIPFIEIRRPSSFRPLDTALKNLSGYDWLILTSVNGVQALWERLAHLRLDRRNLKHLKIAAIGPATKKAIEERGIAVTVVPNEYVAESVVRSLRKQVRGERVLLVRAKVARDVIPRELRKAGAQVEVVEAYQTVVPKSSRAQLQSVLKNPRRRPDFITFTSSSTARNFVALAGPVWGRYTSPPGALASSLGGIRLASIGPVTSATMRELNLPVHVEAKPFTIGGLVEAIVADSRPRSAEPPACLRSDSGWTGLPPCRSGPPPLPRPRQRERDP